MKRIYSFTNKLRREFFFSYILSTNRLINKYMMERTGTAVDSAKPIQATPAG